MSFSPIARVRGKIGSIGKPTLAGFFCLLLLLPALPVVASDEAALASGQGYLLVRVNVGKGERVGQFSFANVDTEDEVDIHLKSFRAAGASAWMALVAAPEGRYYWSKYEPVFGRAIEESRDLDRMYRRNAPSSAEDSFEVEAGVVNYIGDWTMRIVSAERRRLQPVIEYEKSTLERYVTEYPELVNEHEIYLSMMGKEAISLAELAKIIESQSN